MDNGLPTLAQKIDELLEEGAEREVAALIAEEHPADLAEIINDTDDESKGRIFLLLPEEKRPDVLSNVDDTTLTVLLARLSDKEISHAVDELPTDEAADLVGQLDEDDAERVIALLEEEDQESLQKLLEYPEESAGGIMEGEFVAVLEHATVEEAVEALRERADEVERVHNVYVIDGEGRLTGVLPLWRVAISTPGGSVDRFVEKDIVSVPVEMDQEEVASLVKRYDLIEIPVVDDGGRLVGRITVDDVLDVVEEEATEDISRMAGTADEEIHETSVFRISFIRLPWLLIGLAGGIGSAFLISRFEGQLNQRLALAFFVPVIMAMGGNVGIQCSSIVVRAIALEEMEAYRVGRRLLREFLVAVMNGLILAALLAGLTLLWKGEADLGVIVGIALLASVLVAAVVGTSVPMLLKRVGIDPAIATGPFITTTNDLLNLFIYFVVATLMLGRI